MLRCPESLKVDTEKLEQACHESLFEANAVQLMVDLGLQVAKSHRCMKQNQKQWHGQRKEYNDHRTKCVDEVVRSDHERTQSSQWMFTAHLQEIAFLPISAPVVFSRRVVKELQAEMEEERGMRECTSRARTSI